MAKKIPAYFVLLLVSTCRGQDSEQQVLALRPADVRAEENAVLNNLEQRAQATLNIIVHTRTAEEADKARRPLRRRLEKSLGFRQLPWPPDLRSRRVGAIEREGYQIEKIVYQTFPGTLVPAHFYLPDNLKKPAPAVLFYPGHWWGDSKARPDFQVFCINMARKGFVVLTWDPFGQGERGISSRDHRRTEALLVGISQQGFAEYETQCALEYLLSRSEVDAQRIGMTGASGGGYNTWITAALEDRIKVAIPVVGTSEFYEQIKICRPLDWYHAAEHCHFVADLIRYADNHELLAMAAPRPVLIIAASKDESFPIAGVREVYAYGRSLYESYGVPERVGLFEDALVGHGYQQEKREAAYGWFLRWLMNKGDGRPVPEGPTETFSPDSPELRCFSENQPAGPGMMVLIRRLAQNLLPHGPAPDLEVVLGRLPSPQPFDPHIQAVRAQRLEILSEPGIHVPAFLLRPSIKERGVLIALDDRGKEALVRDPVIAETLEKGWAVCGVDPRGIGELRTAQMGWVSAVSLLLGENFVWYQAWDLRRAIAYLSEAKPFSERPFALYARGHNSTLAATYALAQKPESSLKSFVLRDGFLSLREFLDRPKSLAISYVLQLDDRDRMTSFDREIPFCYFVFNALRSFDLPHLLASTRARGLVVNPLDGDWKPLDESEARALLPPRVWITRAASPERAILDFLQAVD